jgi:hypothetical protein
MKPKLGDSPITFQRWRNAGIEVISPTYVRTFFVVLGGARTVREVAEKIGMAETTAASHLKRLRSWGLIDWGFARAGTIHPLYEVVDVPAVSEGSVLAFFDWDWPMTAEPVTDDEVITNVMDLRKGDTLAHEGLDYPVKEVRKAKRRTDASVRLTDPTHERGEFWVRIPLDAPVKGRRTALAVSLMSRADNNGDKSGRNHNGTLA